MKLLELLYHHGLTLEVTGEGAGYNRRAYVIVTAPDGDMLRVLLKDAVNNRTEFVRQLNRWCESRTKGEGQ